jgi:hypothetical protein
VVLVNVSVIVPVKNAEATLFAQLEALSRQWFRGAFACCGAPDDPLCRRRIARELIAAGTLAIRMLVPELPRGRD